MKTIYFSGNLELSSITSIPRADFLELGGIPSKHNYFDSFRRLAGKHDGVLYPVTRTIFVKDNPSLHKCGTRCQHAKGHDCECECGGKNHGIGA